MKLLLLTSLFEGLCSVDSDCFSNQCCALGLFCVQKESAICDPMKAITDGLKYVGTALINFGKAVGSTVSNLVEAAAKGIYK